MPRFAAMPQTGSGDLLADRRYAYAEACLADGDAAAAAEMAEQALERAPRFAAAWLLLGRAREARHAARPDPALFQAALRAYETARELDPEDGLGVLLDLSRLGGAGTLPVLSPAYLRALFDGYAGRFERHLVEGLRQRGPQLLRDALDAADDEPAGGVRYPVGIDLGCGTGLVGDALGPRVGHLTGVDLAPAMLAVARTKGSYARLVESGIDAFLAGEPPASADLCVAADVFIYLGPLGPVLDGIARVLRPGGRAAFTVQSHDGAGVILGSDGRYAHADAHVAEAAEAAGLTVLAIRSAAVRRERGCDVSGRVVVARKSG